MSLLTKLLALFSRPSLYEELRAEDTRRLMEIVSNSPRKMGEFFAMATGLIEAAKDETLNSASQINLASRNIHTLKGMARGYQLTSLVNTLNELEDELVSHASVFAKTLEQLSSYAKTRETLTQYHTLFKKIYAHSAGQNSVTVDTRLILKLTHELELAAMRGDQSSLFTSINELRAIFSNTLDKVIIDEISMIKRLATELGKPIPEVYINELDIQLGEMGKITLRKVFVHLFQNSIDHGIEFADARADKGKRAEGRILIHSERHEDKYRLRYEDDGQGLAIAHIRAKATTLGLLQAAKHYRDEEIADLIFHPGLSTADLNQASKGISGRGVGMDAVRSFLREAGGDIHIELGERQTSESGFRSFAFLIEFPAPKSSQGPLKRVS